MSDPSDAAEAIPNAASSVETVAPDSPSTPVAETASPSDASLSQETENAGDGQPFVDRRKKAVMGVPIEVVISVGKARPLLSELVGLRRDSVLTLDSKIEDPVEIMIGDRVIARGELQEIDSETGRLCVRLTEVADLSQSL